MDNNDLDNTYRRLDHLMATGRSLPRAPIQRIARDPRVCRVCGATDCDKAACLRSIVAAEEGRAFQQHLARHATAASRDAGRHRHGTRR